MALVLRVEELLKTLRIPYDYHLKSNFISRGLIYWKNHNEKFLLKRAKKYVNSSFQC